MSTMNVPNDIKRIVIKKTRTQQFQDVLIKLLNRTYYLCQGCDRYHYYTHYIVLYNGSRFAPKGVITNFSKTQQWTIQIK